jgi:hypothetical protein
VPERQHPNVRPVRARTFVAAAAAVISLFALPGGPARAAITIQANQWVKQAAPFSSTLQGFTGTFEARGWNHMLYDPVGKRMILYDGYIDPTRPTSIYANALWTYDALANRLSLESVSNWARVNGVTVPLAQNTVDPTPYDRHSYSCIAFVPETNRLYLWGGANNSVATNYLGDTWVYDFVARKWREITAAAHPFTVFEQAMTYDPNTHRLVVAGGADAAYHAGDQAWLFNVDTETWEMAATPSAPPARMSQSLVFDPVRRVSYLFGGGTYPNPGNELWSFDAAARTWRQIPAQGAVPPPRRFGALAYDSRHDIVLLWGGMRDDATRYNDTWIFRPSTRQWTQLSPAVAAPGDAYNAEDLAYDSANDVFVLHQGNDFWLFRYAPAGDATAPSDIQDLKTK